MAYLEEYVPDGFNRRSHFNWALLFDFIRRNLAPYRLLCFLAIVLVLYLVVTPLLYMISSALTGSDEVSLSYLWSVFTGNAVLEATLNSILVASGVAFFSVIFGVPLAFGTERTSMRGRSLVRVSVIIAIISPDFFLAMAYVILMGPNSGLLNELLHTLAGLGNVTALGTVRGPLNIFTLWGFIFVALPTGVAFVYMQVAPAFQNMDPSLEEAARTSGGSACRTISRITLPLIRPAIMSGALLAFAIALAMYGTPHILGVDVLTTLMRNSLLVDLNLHRASAIAVIATIITMITMFSYQYFTRAESRYKTVVGKSFQPRPMQLGMVRHVLTGFGILYAVIAFVLPYGTMALISFSEQINSLPLGENFTINNYIQVFTNQRIVGALANSLWLALGSATIITVTGAILGKILINKRSVVRSSLDILAMLPLGISGTALAVALLIMYIYPPFGLLPIYGTIWILLIAYTTRFLGFGIRSAKSGIGQISGELEECARTSGAGPLRALWSITAPLARGSLTFAWILVFIQAFPEISASVLLKSIGVQTSATVIMNLWDGSGGYPLAAALATVIFVVIALLMVVAQRTGAGKAAWS